jgi:hypothetical protein
VLSQPSALDKAVEFGFSRFDKDGSGFIERSELMGVLEVGLGGGDGRGGEVAGSLAQRGQGGAQQRRPQPLRRAARTHPTVRTPGRPCLRPSSCPPRRRARSSTPCLPRRARWEGARALGGAARARRPLQQFTLGAAAAARPSPSPRARPAPTPPASCPQAAGADGKIDRTEVAALVRQLFSQTVATETGAAA